MTKRKSNWSNPQELLRQAAGTVSYGRVAVAATGFIVAGAVFYHLVEKLSWIDAFYFTVVTLATVGYGDIAPKTDTGKIFTVFYILIGITIFVVLARLVLGGLLLRSTKKRQK